MGNPMDDRQKAGMLAKQALEEAKKNLAAAQELVDAIELSKGMQDAGENSILVRDPTHGKKVIM